MTTVFKDEHNVLTDLGNRMYRHEHRNGPIRWSGLIPREGRVLVLRKSGRPDGFVVVAGSHRTGFIPLVKPITEDAVREFGKLFSAGSML